MQLGVHLLPLILFCLAVSLIIVANIVFHAILGEVNEQLGQQEKISELFVNLKSFRVLKLHKGFFPFSRKRIVMNLVGALGLALGLASFLVEFR